MVEDMLNMKLSPATAIKCFTKVDLPAPEGPTRTSGLNLLPEDLCLEAECRPEAFLVRDYGEKS